MLKKEIHLEKSGTLHKFLTSYEKDNVTHLILSGHINSKDFDVLDDICSSNGKFIGEAPDNEFIITKNEPPYLTHLDMENCIMEGKTTLPYFTYYSKLEEVILPKNVTKIGSDIDPVFENSYKLKKVIFPATLKEISSCSFANCDLQDIILPENLESIGYYAFSGNKSIRHIKIPKNVSFLVGNTFGGCNIEKFELDDNNPHLSLIDGVIFSKDKTKLVAFPSGYKNDNYIIPNGTKTIGYAAFCNSKIKSITFPPTLETIEDFAFETCYNIECMEIPNSVIELGKWAFRFCTSLKSVKLPDTMTILKENTFVGCNNLKELEIPNSVKIIEQNALCCTHNLEKLILHDGLEEINDDLKFMKISKVYIPKTVKKILSGTPMLAQHSQIQFDVDIENQYLCSINGSLYDKNMTILISAYRQNANTFIVPDGVKKIADYVFWYTKLETIVLPDSLTTLGHRCFEHCKLKEIRLPKSMTAIDFRAFGDCENLEKMMLYAEQPPEITNPLSDCWKFMGESKKLILYVPKECVETYKSIKYWKDIKHIQAQ
ncbi:MAG: leucine-rich repeat domain-containing protein [Prevotellaceae bacterium]|jgi:hypothetical protein|nr:leucine-rich repeat domain-containing protein [Prevotellaceae bacterium]